MRPVGIVSTHITETILTRTATTLVKISDRENELDKQKVKRML